MWREICTGVMGVMTYIHWVVRDECIADFFHDSWLSNLRLSKWPTFINMEMGESTTISNLSHTKGSSWRPNCVTQLFDLDLAMRVFSIVVPT